MFFKRTRRGLPAPIKGTQSGFSIIELLITATIIIIITTIIVARYGSFNSSVLLKNQAYEVALAIREAQVFTLSARGDSGNFREEYGVSVDVSRPQQIEIYLAPARDRNANNPAGGLGVAGSSVLETLRLDSRFRISRICYYQLSGNTCNIINNAVSVQFARPNFDPTFFRNNTTLSAREINIDMQSIDGAITRTVVISASGQISVK